MNCGVLVDAALVLVGAGRVNAGAGLATSISFWIRIRDAILFLDARLTWFRRLPRICLLTVLILVLVSLDVGGLVGPAASRYDRLGRDAIPLGLALALPLLMFWVCLGFPLSGEARLDFVAVSSGTGSALAFLLLFFWVCSGLPLGSTLALSMLVFWVCLRSSPLGGGSVAVISVTGVLRRVCR